MGMGTYGTVKQNPRLQVQTGTNVRGTTLIPEFLSGSLYAERSLTVLPTLLGFQKNCSGGKIPKSALEELAACDSSLFTQRALFVLCTFIAFLPKYSELWGKSQVYLPIQLLSAPFFLC